MLIIMGWFQRAFTKTMRFDHATRSDSCSNDVPRLMPHVYARHSTPSMIVPTYLTRGSLLPRNLWVPAVKDAKKDPDLAVAAPRRYETRQHDF